MSYVLFCTLFSPFSYSHDRKLEGTNKGEQQVPFEGATVAGKNSLIAATTNAEG